MNSINLYPDEVVIFVEEELVESQSVMQETSVYTYTKTLAVAGQVLKGIKGMLNCCGYKHLGNAAKKVKLALTLTAQVTTLFTQSPSDGRSEDEKARDLLRNARDITNVAKQVCYGVSSTIRVLPGAVSYADLFLRVAQDLEHVTDVSKIGFKYFCYSVLRNSDQPEGSRLEESGLILVRTVAQSHLVRLGLESIVPGVTASCGMIRQLAHGGMKALRLRRFVIQETRDWVMLTKQGAEFVRACLMVSNACAPLLLPNTLPFIELCSGVSGCCGTYIALRDQQSGNH